MATPTVYVICNQNCKHEGMTKEQILTAIMQAVNEGTIGDVDAGFITTIKTINDKALKFFVGEQSAYDALTDEEKTNLFAIITNDTTKEGIEQAIKDLQTATKANGENIAANTAAITRITKAPAARAVNNTSGAITKAGFYYIDVRNINAPNYAFPIGVIYWQAGLFVRKIFGYLDSVLSFNMTDDGSIDILEGSSDVTDDFEIFVTQWGA